MKKLGWNKENRIFMPGRVSPSPRGYAYKFLEENGYY